MGYNDQGQWGAFWLNKGAIFASDYWIDVVAPDGRFVALC